MVLRSFLFVCLFSSMILSAEYGWSKPAPPEGLNDVIAEFAELEEKFESDEWAGAQESLSEIDEKLEKISESVAPEQKKDFHPQIKSLRNFIHAKNFERTEKAYLKLQLEIFDYANLFNYRIHPILSIIKKYIEDEAMEALEKGDFDDVKSEMKEVANLIKSAKPQLKSKGVSDSEIQAFRGNAAKVIGAANAKDKSASEKYLGQVREQYSSFLAR